MVKKRKVLIFMLFFIVILFFYIVSLSSASADNNESNDLEYTNEDFPLPDYGPQVFEEAKKHPGFVAIRGTMPVITDAAEKMKWIDLLVNSSRSLGNPYNTNTGVLPYFVEFGGPVMSFGTYIDGYLLVQFEGYSSEKVNESLIDEIYQVIDKQCKQEGINDVPVVFEFGGYEKEDLTVDDRPDTDESDDANLSDSDKTTGNKTTNQMTGFTSIMGTLGVLSFFIVKRLT